MIKIMPIGGALEIGANSYYIKWDESNILLDCGMHPAKMGYNRLPLINKIDRRIDLLYISHSHMDHLGSLPVIDSTYDVKRIVMGEGNINLVQTMLIDSARIYQDLDLYNGNFYRKYFSRTKIYNLINKIEFLSKNKFIELNKKIKFKLFKNGHIAGSTGIYIIDQNKNDLIFTGDFSIYDNLLVGKPQFPNVNRCNILISETTNGNSDYDESQRRDNENRLIHKINETLSCGGRVLLPAFALGKTQELLYFFERYSDKIIPSEIFTIGLSNKITPIYRNLFQQSIQENKSIYKKEKNCIIITTSGMLLEGTTSYKLAKEIIEEENSLIAFTGYYPPGSFAELLIKTQKGSKIEIDGKTYIKKANVEYFPLSLHSSCRGIVSLINRINPIYTLLVHGDENSIRNIKKKIAKSTKVIVPENGDEIIFKNNKMVRRRDMKSYIVTVGTAVFTNFQKTFRDKEPSFENVFEFMIKGNPEKVSAETNTIYKLGRSIDRNTYFYLLASDTKDGIMSCELLKAYIEQKYKADAEIIKIEGLNTDANSFESVGLIKFVKKVSNIIDNTKKNVEILATGGYKAEIAYATVLALLYRIPVYYVFEDFKSIVKLPQMPLDFDFKFYELFYDTIEKIKNEPDIKIAKRILNEELVEEFRILLNYDKNLKRYVDSPVGKILHDYYKNIYSTNESGTISIKLGDNSSHRTIWGKGFDGINSITDRDIRKIIKRINKIGKGIITGFILDEMKNSKRTNENYLEFEKKIGEEGLSYWIKTNNGCQRLNIYTKARMNDTLLDLIGKKIYE